MILIFLLVSEITIVPTYYTNTNYIYEIVAQDSLFYCATNGGVVRYEYAQNRFTVVNNTDGLHMNRQTCIALDSAGYVWTGSELGLCVIDPGFNDVQRYPGEYLAGSIIQGIHCRRESVYVASSSGLLFIDTKGTPSDFLDDVRLRIFESNGLPSDNVLSVAVDDTLVWVGTSNGLVTFSKDFTNPVVYQTGNGLLSNVINDLVFMDTCVLVATDNGLNRFCNGLFDSLLVGPRIDDMCLIGDSLVLTFDTLAQVGFYFAGDTTLIRSGLPYRCKVNSVTSDNGELYCGLGNRYIRDYLGYGIGHYDVNLSAWDLTRSQCLTSNHISSITSNEHGVFIACGAKDYKPSGGIGWLKDNGEWVSFFGGAVLPTDKIHRCVTAPDGKVWFAVNNFPDIDSSLMVFSFEPQDGIWHFIYNHYLDMQGCQAVWDIDFDSRNNMYLSLAGPDNRLWVIDSSLSTTYYLGEEHNGFVVELAIDSAGKIWRTYVTDQTLVMVDTRNTLFDRSDDPGDAQFGISDGLISQIGLGCLVDRHNNLYIANDTGLVAYDGSDFTVIPEFTGHELLDLELDSQGRIWIMARDGMYYYDPALSISDGWQYNELAVHIDFLGPSNEVIQLQGFEFDAERQCFWLGGETGLLKLAIQGDTPVHLDSVVVYPNPAVRQGEVKIKNIPADSRVNIYTISGRLLAHDLLPDKTFGEVVWVIPEDACSGLYFALVKTSRGSMVCKFAIVK